MLWLLWKAKGANLSWRKGKYGHCVGWTGTTITVRPHLGFSAVWMEIHQHKAAELLALAERLSLRKDSWTSKKFDMSLESSAGPVVSSHRSRLFHSALWAAIMKHSEFQED